MVKNHFYLLWNFFWNFCLQSPEQQRLQQSVKFLDLKRDRQISLNADRKIQLNTDRMKNVDKLWLLKLKEIYQGSRGVLHASTGWPLLMRRELCAWGQAAAACTRATSHILMHSPTTCMAQFQTGHGPVVGCGLGTPDLDNLISKISILQASSFFTFISTV